MPTTRVASMRKGVVGRPFRRSSSCRRFEGMPYFCSLEPANGVRGELTRLGEFTIRHTDERQRPTRFERPIAEPHLFPVSGEAPRERVGTNGPNPSGSLVAMGTVRRATARVDRRAVTVRFDTGRPGNCVTTECRGAGTVRNACGPTRGWGSTSRCRGCTGQCERCTNQWEGYTDQCEGHTTSVQGVYLTGCMSCGGST